MVQLAMVDSPNGRLRSNNFRCHSCHEYSRKLLVNYYNRCCHAFLLVAVVVSNHLQMLLNRLSLISQKQKQSKINIQKFSNSRRQFNSINFEHLPIELRLLLSPDNDCESTPVCEPFIFGLTMLVGLDKRFSRSTSDRNGLFGVN